MLYEVITIREFTAAKEHKQNEQKSTTDQLAERKLDLDQKKGELNEIVAETRQEEERLREQAKQIRITSYNVCYTKLLRCADEASARPGSRRRSAVRRDPSPDRRPLSGTWPRTA